MNVNAHTGLFCVIGDPISHSLSPLMQNAAFKHAGINGIYLAFRVESITDAVAGMRGFGIRGASVTIPHKVSVMGLLDEVDDTARKIGAVNTVVNHDGRLLGSNTDCTGAIAALKEKTDVREKTAVVMGAGGAARAVGFGLDREGARVKIVNRTIEKGENLANELNAEFIPMTRLPHTHMDILINTTSVGMTPDVDRMPVDEAILDPSMTVMDIVYNPVRTKLLQRAAGKGCTVVDGVSMFVFQGAAQFETWTGLKAPVDLMRRVVLDALDTSNAGEDND